MDNLKAVLPVTLWRLGTLVAIVLALAVLCPNAVAASRPRKIPVYVLNQTGTVFGDQVVYVSPTCVRLDMKRIGCSVVHKAPGEKVQMWSTKKKLYYENNLRKWHEELAKLDGFERKCKKKGIKWRVIKTVDICGITCDQYILGRLRGATDPVNLSLPKDPEKRKVFVAKKIPISKESATLIGRTCKIPSFEKLPMRVQAKGRVNNDICNVVETVSCEKKMLPESTFLVPPKFAKTENEFDVFVQFGSEADPMTGIEDILFKSRTGRDKPSK